MTDKKIATVGCVLIALCLVFPPMQLPWKDGAIYWSGYAPFWNVGDDIDGTSVKRIIDAGALGVEIAGIFLATTIMLYANRRR